MSGLRCRPGDLAVIVRAPAHAERFIGAVVTVLYLAPEHDHRLPNGVLHDKAPGPDCWIVKFACSADVPMLCSYGVELRSSDYGCVPDWALRPIRPDADEPATETEREKEAA